MVEMAKYDDFCMIDDELLGRNAFKKYSKLKHTFMVIFTIEKPFIERCYFR